MAVFALCSKSGHEPGLNGEQLPRGGGGCSILGWLLRAPGMETGAAWPCGSFGPFFPFVSPFLVPPLASSHSSHPPPRAEESLFPVSYLSLAPQCGFPFRSGLVLFGASPGLQHPAPTRLHVQPRGGQKPCTPPKCTQMQLHGGAEGHAT